MNMQEITNQIINYASNNAKLESYLKTLGDEELKECVALLYHGKDISHNKKSKYESKFQMVKNWSRNDFIWKLTELQAAVLVNYLSIGVKNK